MGDNLYIFKNGILKRKDNTIRIETEQGQKIDRPIENIDVVYLFGEITLNTKLLNFLSQNRIVLHVFNYYGFYSGSYYPREHFVSGVVEVAQAKYYLNPNKRVELAYKFVEGAVHNALLNLRYYQNRNRDLSSIIEKITSLSEILRDASNIPKLMGIEGNIKEYYYKAFNEIVRTNIHFDKRVKRPPDNLINALISFGNMMLYTTVLGEIYKTQLNPVISFLHEPGQRRFSLALDVSEVFKPIIVDRVIFSILNKGQITEKDGEKDFNYYYLKESARKKFIMEYDKKLKTTIKHKKLKRHVSYRTLIRLELYKLIKHLIEEQPYEPFRGWW